jgi:hypothetical protein
MPSTYSPSLRLELIGSGEQSGTWGTTTNTNLGTLLEQSIVGVQDITMFDVNYTLSNFNGVSDEARKAVLVVSGTNTAARDIIAPLVAKTYTIKNNTTGGFAINIKAATGSSVSISNGATSIVYCDGTNFNLAVNQTAVAAGTGISIATVGATNTVSINSTVATLTGTQTLTNKTLTAPNLGTPTVLVGTNITGTAAGLSIGGNAATVTTNANLTGAVTSVGNATTVVTNANLTGAITSVGNASSLGSFTSAQLATALTDKTGTDSAVFATSPTLVTPALGTPSALVGTNITGTASGLTAGYVTNGVYTTGTQTIGGSKTFSSTVLLADGGVMFASDGAQDTGISWASDGVMNVRCNASTVGQFTSSGFTGNSATATNATNATTVTTNANLTGAVTSVGNASSLGSFTSAQLATALTNETGSGSAVFGTSPTIVSPNIVSPTISGAVMNTMASSVLTSKTAQTASGATVSFTGIPSWAKRITVLLTAVTTVSTGLPAIRAGAGSYEATGYSSTNNAIGASSVTSTLSATTSWDLANAGGSSNVYSGQLVITRLEGYLYTIAGQVWYGTSGSAALTTGYKTFSGDISQLQLRMSTGADTFNGGSINVMYE